MQDLPVVFFKHAGCRKRSCRRMVDFGVSFSVSTYSQVLLCWQTLPLQHRAAPAVRRSSAAPPPRTPASDARAPAAAPRCRTESHPAEGDAVKTVMDDDKVTDQACCHCTNWREIDVMAWDVRWSVYEKAQECGTQREACSRHTLPSPCAVFPPPHPGCSQATPRRRWRPDDSSASPPVPQSAIPETRSAPRNNEPKGHKVRTGLCCLCVHTDPLLHSRGNMKGWCVTGSRNSVCPHQFNQPDQAVVEGSDDGAVLDKPGQTLLVELLGSDKVQLVTVTLVNSRTPERTHRTTDRTELWTIRQKIIGLTWAESCWLKEITYLKQTLWLL